MPVRSNAVVATHRSRRSLIVGAVTGLAGLVAGRLGHPDAVAAAAGDPLLVGQVNDAGMSPTTLLNAGPGATITVKTTNASTGGAAVFGWAANAGPNATRGLYGRADGPNSNALVGRQLGGPGSGAALLAEGGSNPGVIATTTTSYGVAILASTPGGLTKDDAGSAVRGFTAGATRGDIDPTASFGYGAGEFAGPNGVIGATIGFGGAGVIGVGGPSVGVRGVATGGIGVVGASESNVGVFGDSTAGAGVEGSSPVVGVRGSGGEVGVEGTSTDGVGMYATSINDVGLYALTIYGDYAAWLAGNTHVNGTLSKSAGSFMIDHPLDPGGQLLSHSFVESPDMLNVYAGTATIDDSGSAVVELPDWFEALNREIRYQLTPLGAAAPELHVASEVADHRFVIAGGPPGLAVCWQVTGVRHDAYAQAHRIPVEQAKTGSARGTYLHPELHGQPTTATFRPGPSRPDEPVPE